MNAADRSSATNDQCTRGVTRRSLLIWIVSIALFAGGALYVSRGMVRAREAAVASRSQGPFNQLLVALHSYHDTYGCFPPAYVTDDAGNRMHSWRTLILPFVDQVELSREYDFSEPWNGPKNSRLARRMPSIFRCESAPDSDRCTNTVVIVGPETAFPGAKSTSLSEFEDGTDHTILLAEVANSGIEWLEPRDLEVDTMSFSVNDRTRPSISTTRRNGPYVVFADCISTHALSESLPPEVVRSLTTIRGQEPLSMAHVNQRDFRGLVSLGTGPDIDVSLKNFPDWESAYELWLTRSQFTDAGLACLSQAGQLHIMHLAGSAITDRGLVHLKERKDLYLLDLSGTVVSDAGLLHLAELAEMQSLNLRGTRVTPAGVEELRRLLPKTAIKYSPKVPGD